jgi:hypothetical protein
MYKANTGNDPGQQYAVKILWLGTLWARPFLPDDIFPGYALLQQFSFQIQIGMFLLNADFARLGKANDDGLFKNVFPILFPPPPSGG